MTRSRASSNTMLSNGSNRGVRLGAKLNLLSFEYVSDYEQLVIHAAFASSSSVDRKTSSPDLKSTVTRL
jgi:hypothetical protein